MKKKSRSVLVVSIVPLLVLAVLASQTSLIQAAFNPTIFSISQTGFAKKKNISFSNSKLIKKINHRQAKRQKYLIKFKAKGLVGESDSGFLAIRKTMRLKKKELEKLNKVVEVENSDRKKLYAELAKINGYGKKQMEFLRFTMVESYLRFDSKGVYYFRADSWQKK